MKFHNSTYRLATNGDAIDNVEVLHLTSPLPGFALLLELPDHIDQMFRQAICHQRQTVVSWKAWYEKVMENSVEPDELEKLLARIALKDQEALEKLYKRVAPKLNGVAMIITHDADLSNDVLQETFLQIWHKAGEYRRGLSEPMTWMTSLLRYRALDKLKSENREQKRREQHNEIQLLFEDDHFGSPLTAILQKDSNISLHHCLQALEVLNRNAILMAYYYGYSREDIAIHIAKPINTVKVWLKRGLERLAKCLGH